MAITERTIHSKSPRKQDLTSPTKAATATVGTTSTTFHTKPLPTGSIEAQNAASQVTPARIGRILVSRGPLAIRFITQSLSDEIPHFKDLSTSKQRRLIMTAMERGDEANSIIFEKLGWGLWGTKRVDPESFNTEREIMNKLNAKVKDSTSSSSSNYKAKERKLSGGNNNTTRGRLVVTPPTVTYIDENVLQTDEDEDEDDINIEDDIDDMGRTFSYKNQTKFLNSGSAIRDRYRRRPSAVVYDTTNNNNNNAELASASERELLAQKVRSTHKSNQVSNLRRLSIGSHLSMNESIASSYSNSNQNSRDNNVWDIENSFVTAASSGSSSNTNQTLNERLSRRSSRLSVSKESGIRSTLSPLRNRKLVYRVDNGSSNNSNSNFRIDQELDHLYSGSGSVNGNININGSSSAIASDTDEEDWARIGAASLLRSRSRSRSGSRSMSMSISMSGSGSNSPQVSSVSGPTNSTNTGRRTVPDGNTTFKSRSMSWTQTEPVGRVLEGGQQQQHQQQPSTVTVMLLQPPLKSPFTSNSSDEDTNETARLLLSLK